MKLGVLKLSLAMNNFLNNKTLAAQAIRNAKNELTTVSREDSLTQLVKEHAIKTKPATMHSYDKLIMFTDFIESHINPEYESYEDLIKK